MTFHPVDLPTGAGVRICLAPEEHTVLLDLTASSRHDGDRRLFWKLVPANGGTHAEVTFSAWEVRELCAPVLTPDASSPACRGVLERLEQALDNAAD